MLLLEIESFPLLGHEWHSRLLSAVVLGLDISHSTQLAARISWPQAAAQRLSSTTVKAGLQG